MTEAAWQPIEANDLRIGHYVRIGDRWFDHPFLKGTFLLSTEEELAAIRAADLALIYIDPARSQVAAAATPADRIPVLQPAPASLAPPVLKPAEGSGLAEVVAEAARIELRPAAAAATATRTAPLDVRSLRANLVQSREDYRVAVDDAAKALGMLDAGDAMGCDATRSAVRQVLALAAGRERPLTLAPVAMPVGAPRRQAFLSMDAAALAAAVGRRLQLDAGALQTLTTAAMVHAVGLSRLPPQLREESRVSSRDDLAEFRQYPRLGAELLREHEGFAPEVIQVVEQHRERLDGTGFPARLRSDQIHPLAPVIGAIREFQVLALRDDRPMPAAALAQMYLRLRDAYGASVVEHVIAALTIYPPGTFLALSDGQVARVARVSDRARLAPLVWIYDADRPAAEAPLVDLSEPGRPAVQRVLDPKGLSEAVRAWFGGEWAGLTFPAPVAPPMGARPPRVAGT